MSLRPLKIPQLPFCQEYFTDNNGNVYKKIKPFYPNSRSKKSYIKITHKGKKFFFNSDAIKTNKFESILRKKVSLFSFLTDQEYNKWNKYLNLLNKDKWNSYNENVENSIMNRFDEITKSKVKKRYKIISDILTKHYITYKNK